VNGLVDPALRQFDVLQLAREVAVIADRMLYQWSGRSLSSSSTFVIWHLQE